MGKHDFPAHALEPDAGTITVAELLERAACDGQTVRLNWTVEDTDQQGFVVVLEQDEWQQRL